MIAFIDHHRTAFRVEAICKLLPIDPSTYHERTARLVDPSQLPARTTRDQQLVPKTKQVVRRI
jgi:hypothetical protein